MTDLAWMKTYIGTEAALTGHLTAEEFGAYERLRRHYWQHACLPEDEARLMRVAGVELDRWASIASAIRSLLAEALPRLDQERSEASSKREKKVAAGRKGAEARWQADGRTNANANSKGMANAMAEPMRNQWPLASASDEERYEEGLEPPRMRARETLPSEEPIEPFPGLEEAEAFLRRKGVPDVDLSSLVTKLQAWRLYPGELQKYGAAA